MSPRPDDEIKARAKRLGLFGLLSRWDDFAEQPWVATLLQCEESERGKRSLGRRLHSARLGAFKPMADFDWKWPRVIDKDAIEDFVTLEAEKEGEATIIVASFDPATSKDFAVAFKASKPGTYAPTALPDHSTGSGTGAPPAK